MGQTHFEYARKAFKAYDIRGRVPGELNEEVAYRIGRAYVSIFKAKKVVVGRDIRISSESLAAALARGLNEAGCDVLDIGLCGTEQVYFSTAHLGADGGIMVTASHNPHDYNGMKLVREHSKPISGDSGLRGLEDLVVSGQFGDTAAVPGAIIRQDMLEEYLKHLLTYVDVASLKPLKVVANAGNGCAGPIIKALEKYLPFSFIHVHGNPDGNFPNGIPNPLLPENRAATADVVKEHKADVGIAWDGDFDRCFLFDENGEFVEGYYIVGFLAQAFLARHPGAKVIHDPRLIWNTQDLTRQNGGFPIESKTGHAFIKERMRQEDAVYGGEMSAHHYFRDFFYCDSGMIPWLLVLAVMCKEGKTLSQLFGERMALFPVSGEINREVSNPKSVIEAVEKKYMAEGPTVERIDGLSMSFGDWRFNLRMSNTEPVIRLNVETKNNRALMERKTQELLSFIDGIGS